MDTLLKPAPAVPPEFWVNYIQTAGAGLRRRFFCLKQGRIVPNIILVTVTKIEAQAVLETFAPATGQPWTRRSVGDKTCFILGRIGGVEVFMTQSEMKTGKNWRTVGLLNTGILQ